MITSALDGLGRIFRKAFLPAGNWLGALSNQVITSTADRIARLSARLNDPAYRNAVVFVTVFAMSHAWTVMAYLCNRDDGPVMNSYAFTWVLNSVVHSVVHWTFFAWAIMVLVSGFFGQRLYLYFRIFKRVGFLLSLIAIEATVLTIIFLDECQTSVDPYMIRDPLRAPALREADDLRKGQDGLEKAESENKKMLPGAAADRAQEKLIKDKERLRASQNTYEARYIAPTRSLVGKLRYCNLVPAVSFLLTNFFAFFLNVAIWCIFVVLPTLFSDQEEQRRLLKEQRRALKERIASLNLPANESQTDLEQERKGLAEKEAAISEREQRFYRFVDEIFKANILFSCWLPFRFYATWYSSYYLGHKDAYLFFPFVVLSLVEGVALILLLSLRNRLDIKGILAGLGVVLAVLVGILQLVQNDALDRILHSMGKRPR
jgi:hypothetical protein